MFPTAFIVLLWGCILMIEGSHDCIAHKLTWWESSVCVCNSTYCDEIETLGDILLNGAVLYESNRAGLRLKKSYLKFQPPSKDDSEMLISVDSLEGFQYIKGFGGAFTDSAGINMAKLSPKSRNNLIYSYYGLKGIEYSIGRIPMASCDFSTHEYSYDDVDGDFQLKNFALTKEDLTYKIPYIAQAESMSRNGIYFFGSPWSAPAWMKTSGTMNHNGTLKGYPGDKYYTTWANYFVKFLQAYASHNITVRGLTGQNEPTTGFMYNYAFQTMGFTAEMQRDFIKLNLGPALHRNSFGDVELMILDDQRIMLPQWADVVLKDPTVAQFVSGIAVHWYEDPMAFPKLLSLTNKHHPTKFILATEACNGAMPWEKKGVVLGSWYRAIKYASDIITDLNHWAVGWTDWNLALDLNGGPNWVNNVVDSPIIVNATSDQFYKQPMFYALAHFSKFLRPGYQRVRSTYSNAANGIESTSFKGPDAKVVLVLHNRSYNRVKLNVEDEVKPGVFLRLSLNPQSIMTIIWE